MNEFYQLLKFILPAAGALLLLLAAATLLASLGQVILPLGVLAALTIGFWLWKNCR